MAINNYNMKNKLSISFALVLMLGLVLFFLFVPLEEVNLTGYFSNYFVITKTTENFTPCPSDIYSPIGYGPFPAIVFSPGALATKEEYKWFGKLLSDNGYIVLIYTPLGTRNADLNARVNCINQGVNYLAKQKTVDINRIGLAGHSAGGGASIISVANPRIKTILVMAPYTGGTIAGQQEIVPLSEKINCPAIKIPSLFITGGKDDVISSKDVNACYNLISAQNKKWKEFTNANHYSFCNGLICWFKSGAVAENLKQEVLVWLNTNLKK